MDDQRDKIVELAKSFNYRVVARTLPETNVTEFGVYEVYYTELGTVLACSTDPILVTVDIPIEEMDTASAIRLLEEELAQMLPAFSDDILKYEEIPYKTSPYAEDDPRYEGNFEPEDVI